MDFTKLKKIYPNAIKGILDILIEELNKENWSDENKILFIAQCAHESGGFRIVKENLNYSFEGLNRVFPKYFRFAGRDALQYAGKPDAIADVVYANRMGNGDINSHDGSRYKGRGLIQITGKNNYLSCLADLGEKDPTYLETPIGAVRSAIWFWVKSHLYNEKDIIIVTKRVNGGLNGIEDRKEQYNKLRKILLGLI